LTEKTIAFRACGADPVEPTQQTVAMAGQRSSGVREATSSKFGIRYCSS
jgi:hypothetical protein